jgi:peptidoglycan lytic transglycosylase
MGRHGTRSALGATVAGVAWLAVPGPAPAEDQNPVVFREEGEASYYGEQFQGKPTASGEPFDQDDMTAAHPELPLGSEVTVTDPSTGKQVEVNDRGPFVDGRSIDLSKGAAEELGITEEGVAKVEIEATKEQVEEAIDRPKEAGEVTEQLDEAREAAAAGGTAQPATVPELAAPGQ